MTVPLYMSQGGSCINNYCKKRKGNQLSRGGGGAGGAKERLMYIFSGFFVYEIGDCARRKE